jgi:hypothetical protein
LAYNARSVGGIAPTGVDLRVEDFIEQFRAQYGSTEKIREKVLKDYEVNDSNCYYDNNLEQSE